MKLVRDAESLLQLKCAARVAAESPDPSTQNGAVIVSRCGEILSGCNAPVLDVDLTTLTRDEKLAVTEHAERSVIYRCAFLGVATRDATLYCLWASCVPCARAIERSGIRRVVSLDSLYGATPQRWKDEVREGLRFLTAKGIVVDFFDGKIGERILFDGMETEI